MIRGWIGKEGGGGGEGRREEEEERGGGRRRRGGGGEEERGEEEGRGGELRRRGERSKGEESIQNCSSVPPSSSNSIPLLSLLPLLKVEERTDPYTHSGTASSQN